MNFGIIQIIPNRFECLLAVISSMGKYSEYYFSSFFFSGFFACNYPPHLCPLVILLPLPIPFMPIIGVTRRKLKSVTAF